MKSIEYFDVIFVIENSASCGGYLNEIKTNYIHPALEYFCNGLLQEESTNLFGIVLFKTSQTAPLSNCCTSYGPFTAQKFMKTIDNLELTSGRGEQCANLVEGLASALVCFQDLEERRDTEFTTQKHCILISNSPPYSMPVTECFEYEGKNVEQLAGVFNEKNINLSIISPRKIPVLYDLYEKSGGDLGLTAKNYSKDPRHLVLLKGFSLKELIHEKRAESPPANQQQQPAVQQAPQPPAAPQTQQQPNMQQMLQQGSNEQPQQAQQIVQMPGQTGPMGMRQVTPNIRPTQQGMPTPQGMMVQQQQQPQMQQQNVMQMNNQGQFGGMNNFPGQQPQRVMNPQQQAPQQQQQRWMAPNQTPQQRQQFMMNVGNNNMMQTQNSALINQLNQPSTLPMTGPPQQQQQQQQQPQQLQQQPGIMRMPMVNQQQNPAAMMQNQAQNPNMAMQNPNMMAQQVGMMQANQQQPQQPGQMNAIQQNPSGVVNQQQQQGQIGAVPPRDRIWRGILEWNDKQNQQNQVRQVPCEIYAIISKETNEVEIRGDTWPNRLIMQLMPRSVISNVGGQLLRDAKVVQFSWGNSEAFESLSKVMSNGFAGCVHFTGHQQCDVKILILLYMSDKKSYYGFVPNDQAGYVEKLRRVIQQSKITQFGQNPGPGVVQQQPQAPQVPNPQQQMQGQVPRMPINAGNQNMMQADQSMMFNQQQQRMTRPNMMAPNNNLRHLLQQQQSQFRPQMGGPQQQQGGPNQMQQGRTNFDMDPNQYDMNFQMN